VTEHVHVWAVSGCYCGAKRCKRRMESPTVLAYRGSDLGVRFATGEPLVRCQYPWWKFWKRLESGQYTFKDGGYTFSKRDVGKAILFEEV
jgi:hypothetical protein